MKRGRTIILVGLISIWLYFLLEIVTDIWFGSVFPGYNWKTQSISYLGQSGSPVEHWVTIWGVLFSVLITLFVLAFYKVYKAEKWVAIASFSLLIYGLGEGIGSGCFPINPPGLPLTLDGKLHNIFGGIGDAGIVIFPFLLMMLFARKKNYKWQIYLWTVVGIGLTMAGFFLIAKYYRPDNFILEYKGVWQRIYTLNYDLMLLFLSFTMGEHKTGPA